MPGVQCIKSKDINFNFDLETIELMKISHGILNKDEHKCESII